MHSSLLVRFLAVFVPLLAWCAAADQLFFSMRGAKQGDIYTSTASTIKGAPPKSVLVDKFTWGVTSPIDASTGLATGKIQFTQITISRIMDASAPRELNAFAGREQVLGAELTVMSPVATTGALQRSFSYVFTSGFVTSVNYSFDDTLVENITLTFDKVELDSFGAAQLVATVSRV